MAGKNLQAIVQIAGEISPTLGKSIEGATSKLAGINIKALAVGAAVGGIAIATGKAVVEAGKYLADLGGRFDDVTDTIRIGTGATGEALAGLNKDFDAIYSSVPASMDDAAKAVSDFNTRLGLSGPELQNISKQALQVSSMLGDDLNGVIEESSKAFQQWGVDSKAMGGSMDYIFKVSQSTGTGFTDLMTKMQEFGPQLQDMGYSFETASTLVGQLEKAGVNTDEVLGAMKKSVTTLAKQGISASDGLNKYYEQIKNAGTAAEAAALASEVFGARAGSTMASAIRNGTLAVGDLNKQLMANQETINGAAEDTYDFSQRLQVMKQGLEVALKPIANTVFDGLNKFMPTLQKLMEKITPAINTAVDAAMPFVENFLAGAADMLESLLPMLADLASSLLPILSNLVQQLLPPLLQLAQALLPPLMQIVQAILPPIAGLLTTILPMITQIASAILPVIADLFAQLLPILTPLLQVALQIVQDVITPLMPPIMDLAKALLPPIMEILKALSPILEPIFAVLKPIADVLGTIIGWIAKVVEWVASGLSWVIGLFTGGGDTSTTDAAQNATAAGYASGGFTSGLSLVGEDPRHPIEAVISFDPLYRQENIAYWEKAGEMLGLYNSAEGKSIFSSIDGIPQYAAGGFAEGISIAGEAGTEAVISFDPAYRKENISYWQKAGELLGVYNNPDISTLINLGIPALASGGFTGDISDGRPDALSNASRLMNTDNFSLADTAQSYVIIYDLGGVEFAPQINMGSDADKEELIKRLKAHEADFFDYLEEWLEEREAGRYAPANNFVY